MAHYLLHTAKRVPNLIGTPFATHYKFVMVRYLLSARELLRQELWESVRYLL